MAGADEQLADLAKWVESADARQTAKKALERRGFVGVETGDLLSQTFVQVAARIRRGGEIEVEAGKTIAAYAARTMRNIVLDLIRGRRTDALGYRERSPGDDEIPLIEKLGDAAIDVESEVVGRLGETEVVDALRTHLLVGIRGEVWPESAALSFLTLAIDPERDDTFGPRPEAGVDGLWRYWSALWLAGCADVLPDREQDNGDDVARRKRRERAITKVKERIHAAHAAISDAEEPR